MIQFLIFAILLLVILFFLFRSKKESSGNWIQFYAKGKEVGFTIKDMEQIRRLVSNCNISDPMLIFKSQKQFEKVVRSMVHAVRLSGESNDPQTQIFLSKLFDYYKRIEMAAAESKTRITTSRQISEGQTLRILVPGTGVFSSEVIKNIGNYLTISRPVNSKLTSAMQWHALKISIYFWREDDAGYVFDTEVIDEVFSKGISSLKVEHNDSLFRTQKRKSMRIKFQKPAFLYMVNDAENPHRLETAAGLRCMLEDISETGCAFRVNGQATSGLRLKVQFSLDKVPMCMPATVRSVDYYQETNMSIVHMEADPLPVITRNRILCEVFNLLEEEEDELPFRVIEEETAGKAPEEAQNIPSKQEEAINV
ncbi:MAG: PilZ domain-containing protein [Treponema sp.]|nr:PilZ domain-containing protein [Treponema sp.]MCL2251332.1 PilZ domain-containing protein [Treponema sp.]